MNATDTILKGWVVQGNEVDLIVNERAKMWEKLNFYNLDSCDFMTVGKDP